MRLDFLEELSRRQGRSCIAPKFRQQIRNRQIETEGCGEQQRENKNCVIFFLTKSEGNNKSILQPLNGDK